MSNEAPISREFTRREWMIIQIIITAAMADESMRELFLEDARKIVEVIRGGK